jgi:hypothetical protein
MNQSLNSGGRFSRFRMIFLEIGGAMIFASILQSSFGQAVTYQGGLLNQAFDNLGPGGTNLPIGWYVGWHNGYPPGTGGASFYTDKVTINDGTIGPSGLIAAFNCGTNGLSGALDRSLATAPTSGNSPNGTNRFIEVRVENNVGLPLNAITISYVGKQWRTSSSSGQMFTNYVQFSTNGVNWVFMGSNFNFASPVTTPPDTPLNGNLPPNYRTNLGGTYVPPSPVPTGGTVYLRWLDVNDPSIDPVLGIDSFTFSGASPSPVSILQHPKNTVATAGESAAFSISASGAPIFYQWLSNGLPISGATSSNYMVATTATNMTGSGFSVIVSNSLNSLTSSVATLTVHPDLTWTLLSLTNTPWRYNQTGANLGSAWKEPAYDDSLWPIGRGVLAQENQPVVNPLTNTVLSLTNAAAARIITYYFRAAFIVTNPTDIAFLTFSNLIDDGCVVYLNGTEMYRINLTNGPVNSTWLAASAVEGEFIITQLPTAGVLTPGTNMLAVEVHQTSTNSSDIVLGMAVKANPWMDRPIEILRQPQDIAALLESEVRFQVTAIGLPPMNYQWRRNGAPLPGLSLPFYTVSNVQPSTAGSYDVVVSNSSGSVTSAPALLEFIVTPPVSIALLRATADTSQFGNSFAAAATDGVSHGDAGWAGASNNSPSTLVFQTETNVGLSNGTMLTFTLYQGTASSSNRNYQLGCFRLSATTDDRSTYSDGLNVGGRVTANWSVLEPFTYTADNGATLALQEDLSLLASGGTNTIDTAYRIKAFTALTGITGFRLEALTNASLPNNGPGRSENGGFQLQEIRVGVQPGWTNPHPEVHVTWDLSLANPVQSAAPGDTLVFGGILNNAQGVPLAIRSVGLFFGTIPASTNWHLTFEPAFLMSASLLPVNGYAGPFFQVTLSPDFPTNFFAGGELEVMLETQQPFGQIAPTANHSFAIAIPFTINAPPLTIQRTGADVVLSWPSVARHFNVQSAADLQFPNVWESLTLTSFRDYDRIIATLPADSQDRFFRLWLP